MRRKEILKYVGIGAILFFAGFQVSCSSKGNEKVLANTENTETTENIQEDNKENKEETKEENKEDTKEDANEEKEQKEQEEKKDSSDKTKEEVKNLKDVEIHFINTGNSDSIFIKGEKTLLIDGGDNGDENIIINYIKGKGVSKLDYIIATHPHADHIGALDGVIKNFAIGKLLVANGNADTKVYKDFINAAASKGLSPSVPLEGAKFEIGNGSYFKVFNSNGGSDTNEASLVTMLVNGNDSLVFTGDAEGETEREILGRLPENIDLLKVGHHGSKTSTTSEFLNKLNPEFAVITVGNDNRYNHPHKVTMDKLKNKSIDVHRTDECGSIVFKSTGNGVKTNCSKGSFSYRDGEKVEKPKPQKPKPEKPKVEKPTHSKPQGGNKPSGGVKVWLSATGSKYHTINNCGKMNPNNARQVSLEEAKKSYEDCSKC